MNEDKDETFAAIEAWIKENVNKPIKGFEHKKNKDGSTYSWHKQMEATHEQILCIVKYFLKRDKTPEQVIDFLLQFTK